MSSLTNIKRACFNQPFRLFHYNGTKYAQKLAYSMMDILAPHVAHPKPTDPKLKRIIDTTNNIKGALLFESWNNNPMWKIMQLNDLEIGNFLNDIHGEFSDEIDLTKVEAALGKAFGRDVYAVYCLNRACSLINQKKHINGINIWLNRATPLSDPQLIMIADKLKERKNALVIDYLQKHKNNILGLLVNDTLTFRGIPRQIFQKIQANQEALKLIKQLIMASIPISADDFDAFPTVTKGFNNAVFLLKQKNELTRKSLAILLETYSTCDEALRAQLEAEELPNDMETMNRQNAFTS